MPQKRPRDPSDSDPAAAHRSSRESKKCNECRRRHVKCDERRPKCSNCDKAKAECSYSHSGMRYDHISDRQRRDDVYTEIDDISKRVESLLSSIQSQPTHDDVARLAIDYGWQVSLTPDGQKRITTNIETTSQLAALVPRALSDVYGERTAGRPPHASPASSHDSFDSHILRLPVRLSLSQYLQPYEPRGVTPATRCPCMFAFIMSPSLLGRMSAHSALSASVAADRYSCIHNPAYFAVPSTVAPPIDAPTLARRTRFGDCSLSNVYWNLVKTAQLIDHGNFSQAYVNIGITITKAFNLKLHRTPTTLDCQRCPVDAEVAKRIFWAAWLLDTQVPLLHERRPSIQLHDIHIDRPAVCHGMTDPVDIAYTDCLKWLIEARWLRSKIEHNLASMSGEKDEHKVLNIVTQQIRQLRRFYEHLDHKYKIDTITDTQHMGVCWQRTTTFTVLLEHAMNWLVLFDRFLPALPDPTMTAGTRFPDNLSVSMCRQAADVMTLVFEMWIWDSYDCQFRLFLNHFCNTISIHKYVCRCPGVSAVHKWKAYASLKFLQRLTEKTPEIVQSYLGHRILEDLTYALQDLHDITETGWDPMQETDLIADMARYFSPWQPSYDPITSDKSTNLLAKESSTMFAIIDMRKSAAAFFSAS